MSMKTMRRYFSLLLAVLLVSAPVSALADEYDIGAGDVTINAKEGKQWVSQCDHDHDDDAPVIYGSSTTNTISIRSAENDTATATLSDVTAAAMIVSGDGNAAITVTGDNTLNSSSLDPDTYWYGAYIKNGSTALTGSGSLSLVGQETSLHLKKTNVEVNGVTITASGASDEGIYVDRSTMTINDASVTGTCESDDGICFTNSTLVMNGGSLEGEGDTVGIYFNDSKATVTNDAYVSGTGDEKGIYVYNSEMTVKDSSAVIANGETSGVVVYDGALTVDNGTVTGYCQKQDSVLVKNSKLTVKGTSGALNGMGGENGVRINSESKALVDEGMILGVGSDEGISIKASEVTLDGGIVSGTCEEDDGIYVNESKLTINGGSFTGRSGFLGLYIDASEVKVNDGSLTGIGGAEGIALRGYGTVEYDEETGGTTFQVTKPASLTVSGGTVTGIASGLIPGQVIAAAAEESGEQIESFIMPTAGIYVNKGVSVVVSDGTVSGYTNGNGNAAICGGIYISEHASLSMGGSILVTDSDGNDITDASQTDPTTMNVLRGAVIQKTQEPEAPAQAGDKRVGPIISIDDNGVPEIVFICSRRGTKIEKTGTTDAAAMEALSRNIEGRCIYRGSFAFVDTLPSHGTIEVNFILSAYARQHVTIATVVNGAQITFDRYVSRDGVASITVDRMGDFAVFLNQ